MDDAKKQRLEEVIDLLGQTFSEDEMHNMLQGQGQRVFDLLVESRKVLERLQRRESALEDALKFVADKIEQWAPEAATADWMGLAVWIRSRLPVLGASIDPFKQPATRDERSDGDRKPFEVIDPSLIDLPQVKKMSMPIVLNQKGYDHLMRQVTRRERRLFERTAKQRGCTPVELLNELIKEKSATESKLMMRLIPLAKPQGEQ